jgi:hypothetical protein
MTPVSLVSRHSLGRIDARLAKIESTRPACAKVSAAWGVYWDGGITDYHLHLDYASIADAPGRPEAIPARVLYPHFQAAVVPGWLDKHLKRRHRATARLANVIVLTPDPAGVRTLPNGKLPDRRDFKHYGTDTRARVAAWSRALRESERLRDEFAAWARGASGYAAQPLRRTPPARISESGCI